MPKCLLTENCVLLIIHGFVKSIETERSRVNGNMLSQVLRDVILLADQADGSVWC